VVRGANPDVVVVSEVFDEPRLAALGVHQFAQAVAQATRAVLAGVNAPEASRQGTD
jgi:hypothetical protein